MLSNSHFLLLSANCSSSSSHWLFTSFCNIILKNANSKWQLSATSISKMNSLQKIISSSTHTVASTLDFEVSWRVFQSESRILLVIEKVVAELVWSAAHATGSSHYVITPKEVTWLRKWSLKHIWMKIPFVAACDWNFNWIHHPHTSVMLFARESDR